MGNTVQSMIKHVNNLIQGQAIDLAFSVERAIASSFEIPSSVTEKIEKLPQQYRDIIEASYQKSVFKSFDSGYQYGTSLEKKVQAALPGSLKSSLISDFSDSVKEYSEGAEFDISNELALAYSAGCDQAFDENEKSVGIEGSKGSGSTEEVTAADMQSHNGFPSLQKSDNINQKDAVKQIEEYITKNISDPKAQEVMRYELGIQYGGSDGGANNGTNIPKGMKVEASTEEISIDDLPAIQFEDDTALGSMVGPYAISLLCETTLNVVKASQIEAEECFVVMDNVVTGTASMSEAELVEAVCEKLQLECSENTLASLRDKTDDLSAELTEACKLPGHFVLHASENSYNLSFVFNSSAMKPVINAVEARTKVEAAGNLELQPPQGTLSTKIQTEIQNLAGLKSLGGNSLRELKRVSPGVAGYVSKTISNYRNGKCTQQELATLLKASSRELIEMVFGRDGVGYYDYFTKG